MKKVCLELNIRSLRNLKWQRSLFLHSNMSFLLLRLTLMLCVLKNIPVSTAFLPLTPTRFLTTLNENINPLDLLEASYKSSPPSEPIRSDGLTSVSRLRRTTEVNLIMDLCSESGNDDEAIKNLWDFW